MKAHNTGDIMEEIATCTCLNQTWRIYDNRVECAKCNAVYSPVMGDGEACACAALYILSFVNARLRETRFIHAEHPVFHPLPEIKKIDIQLSTVNGQAKNANT